MEELFVKLKEIHEILHKNSDNFEQYTSATVFKHGNDIHMSITYSVSDEMRELDGTPIHADLKNIWTDNSGEVYGDR